MLDPERVTNIWIDCIQLQADAEPAVRVVALGESVDFNPTRLAGYAQTIAVMLSELPAAFRTPNGELLEKADHDKDGRRWTFVRHVYERLLLLGMGLQWVSCVERDRKLYAIVHG